MNCFSNVILKEGENLLSLCLISLCIQSVCRIENFLTEMYLIKFISSILFYDVSIIPVIKNNIANVNIILLLKVLLAN